MFEPWKTTKPEVTGRGLGLSTSYGLALQQGGLVTYKKGADNTTFVLRIPRFVAVAAS